MKFPLTRQSETDHFADHKQGRSVELRAHHLSLDSRQGGDDAALTLGRAVLDQCHRRVGRQAVLQQLARDQRQSFGAHVNDDGLARPRQHLPVERERAVLCVAGDEHAGLRMVAMGERDAGTRRAAQRRGDAGHDLDRDVSRHQRLELLAAATEHEGVAALQAHHALAGARQRDQAIVDLRLRHAVVRAALADVEALGVTTRQGQHFLRHQPVIDHDIGALQQAMGLQGQEIGIARAGADQMHHSSDRCRLIARAIEHADQFAPRADLVAGQRHLADAAGKDAVPEAPPRARLGQRAAHLLAEDLGEARHPTDGGRQDALDLGLELARQRRRRAAGRDGDGDRRAVDDRRHDEARELWRVDHVHRYRAALGRQRYARLQLLVFGSHEDQRHAGEVGLVESAAGPRDAAVGDELRDLAGDGLGDQRHLRAGGHEQLDLARRRLTAAHHQDAAVLQGHEKWKGLDHAAFLSRAARKSCRISGRQEPQLVPARVAAPTASSVVAPSATALSTAAHDTPKQAHISPPRSALSPPCNKALRSSTLSRSMAMSGARRSRAASSRVSPSAMTASRRPSAITAPRPASPSIHGPGLLARNAADSACRAAAIGWSPATI